MSDEETTVRSRRPETLEPRVAKLELGMERLTEDVKDLASVVRMQGQTVEQEIQKLVVAVTQASGPRKTDWGTIIAGVGLILAIASAAFWPLSEQVKDIKSKAESCYLSLAEHQKLDNHPGGGALIKQLENQNDLWRKNLAEEMTAHETLTLAQHEILEAKMSKTQEKNDLYIEKLWGRIQVLENEHMKDIDKDHDELLLWRQKAMGLTSPNAMVPLVTREPETNK